MEKLTKEKLEELATKFRFIAENHDRKTWGTQWRLFPKGACDVAHQTFAKIIEDEFGVVPNVVAGEADDQSYHVWLEIAGLIIDVTSNGEGVIVTHDRSRHSRWKIVRNDPANFRDPWWKEFCGKACSDIRGRLTERASR